MWWKCSDKGSTTNDEAKYNFCTVVCQSQGSVFSLHVLILVLKLTEANQPTLYTVVVYQWLCRCALSNLWFWSVKKIEETFVLDSCMIHTEAKKLLFYAISSFSIIFLSFADILSVCDLRDCTEILKQLGKSLHYFSVFFSKLHQGTFDLIIQFTYEDTKQCCAYY